MKTIKVKNMCDGIESLVPNSVPSLSQVLLSLNVYRKTGSGNQVDDLHKYGHGLSYTEAKFIGDKWAEWRENQSRLVPSNIKEGSIGIHVVDNIDWKNRNIKGKRHITTKCYSYRSES